MKFLRLMKQENSYYNSCNKDQINKVVKKISNKNQRNKKIGKVKIILKLRIILMLIQKKLIKYVKKCKLIKKNHFQILKIPSMSSCAMMTKFNNSLILSITQQTLKSIKVIDIL